MPYLLNLIYLALIGLASPWLLYCAVCKQKYRQGWAAKLLGFVPLRRSQRPCIWWHAVSVGEVNLLPALVTEWKRRRPEWDCVVSTTTRTGYELARKRFPNESVFYCPLDFTWSVRRALRRVRPDVFVLAELELWPNLIRAAHRRGVRVAVVNGRLSDHSFRGYRRIRWFVRRVVRQIDLVAVQNPRYASRFAQLGAPTTAIHVTGSIKFDGARGDRDQPATRALRRLWGLADHHHVLLAGSTQAPEESMAVEAFRAVLADRDAWRLIVVPRHPERFDDVAQMLRGTGLAWQRRSTLESQGADPAARVLLVDTIGELGAWWGTADIGFVGGSMGQRGGQNMIEPAAYGLAVCFGPNTWNFRDIVRMLLDRNAAVVVHDQDQLNAFVRQCVENPAETRTLGEAARRCVLEQQGATNRTVHDLLKLVPPPAGNDMKDPREAA